MSRFVAGLFGISIAFSVSVAGAAEPVPKPAQAARPVPTDPNGVRGISPAWQAIARGDAAFLAKDYPAAIVEYQAAVKSDPKHGMAHYRLAAALRAKGDLKAAAESIETAERFSGDPRLQAKVLFVHAEIRERLVQLADAKQRWTRYAAFADEAHKTPVVAYPLTADDRNTKIDAAILLDASYKAVRERIAKRNAEHEADANKPPAP